MDTSITGGCAVTQRWGGRGMVTVHVEIICFARRFFFFIVTHRGHEASKREGREARREREG